MAVVGRRMVVEGAGEGKGMVEMSLLFILLLTTSFVREATLYMGNATTNFVLNGSLCGCVYLYSYSRCLFFFF